MVNRRRTVAAAALIVLAGLVGLITLGTPVAQAATLSVGGPGPGNYTSIQAAIDAASPGDTVFVYDDGAPYLENVIVDKSINLTGENRETTIVDGGGLGDVVRVAADWVNITGFTITDGGPNAGDDGVELWSVGNTMISDVDVSSNGWAGIYLNASTNASISTANVSANVYGIFIVSSANLSISTTNAYINDIGIYLASSSNVTAVHNAIRNNVAQAADDNGPQNAWDDGYPSGGNFWSDYVGVDDCSGALQDVCPDPDGIGDTPYVIDADSQDRYPILNPPFDGAPTANAGPDQTVTGQGSTVTLNGSASFDPDGDPITYLWNKTGGPVVTVNNNTSALANFVGMVAGVYTFDLRVADPYGANDTDDVVITVVNAPPVATLEVNPSTLPGGQFAEVTANGSFDPDGELWTRQFGTSASDSAWGVAVNGSAVYVTGVTHGTLPGQTSSGSADAFVRKYDNASHVSWTRQFGTSGNDGAWAVALNASGVYVAGNTGGTLPGQTSSGSADAFVRKYDPEGNELWTRQFGTSGTDVAESLAADASGIYVVGNTGGTLPGETSAGGVDVFLRKYDPNGNELWTRQFGTSGTDRDSVVAANASGVYVAGSTDGTLPGQTESGFRDVFLRKFDTDGNEQWTRQFGSIGTDFPGGVALADSAIYVAGSVEDTLPGQPSAGSGDVFLRSYDTDGNELWTRQFGTAGFEHGHVAVDTSGIYVAGYTDGAFPGQTNAGSGDAFLRKYASGGNEMWTLQFGTAESDGALAVAVDASSVYIAGDTFGTLPRQTNAGGPRDAFLRKYSASGVLTYNFTLGDGTISGDTPTSWIDHSWGAAGVYQVNVTVTDRDGATDTASVTVFVTPPNQRPIADAGPDESIAGQGLTVVLVGTGSFDPDGDPIFYLWGQISGPPVTIVNPTNAVASFFAAVAGIYTFDLRVEDPDGAVDTDNVTITVTNAAPVATIRANPNTARVTQQVEITANGSFDPDGTIVSYDFEFGDSGSTGPQPLPWVRHTYASAGTLVVNVTITDSDGDTDGATTTLLVNLDQGPTADAGPDQSALRNTLVRLDGSGSNDPELDPLIYLWTQVGGPPVTLSDSTVAKPTFTPTLLGSYTFDLLVDDGWGENDTDEVLVLVVNNAPVANAGPDQMVLKSVLVTLDGSASSDPNLDPLTYSWVQTGGPVVILSNPTAAKPTFTPVVVGTYSFDLTVDDGFGGNSTDRVVVTVVNTTPVANAGQDQVIPKNTTVTLDGSASSDPDLDPLTFSWIQQAGPAVTLSDPTSAMPTFTPTVTGMYVFDLTVDDGSGGSDTDQVVVTATNSPPVADAGPDQTALKGSFVTLDGGASMDPDGDPIAFAWVQTAGPAVTLSGASSSNPTFSTTMSGLFAFDLTVTDPDAAIDTDRVVITLTNTPPVANSGPDQAVTKNTLVQLVGTGSSDADGDSITFSWAQAGGPAVALMGSTTSLPTFLPVLSGIYTFTLTVTDVDAAEASDQVVITVTNLAPVANAGPDQPMAAKHQTIMLDGTASLDPDGDPITFLWTAPPSTPLSNVNDPLPTFTATRSGTYTFLLEVDDGDGGTDTDTVVVTVANTPPTANAGPDRSAQKLTGVTLSGALSADSDGDTLVFTWTPPTGITLSDVNDPSPTFVPTVTGTLVFQLTVEDGDTVSNLDSDTVTVTVWGVRPIASLTASAPRVNVGEAITFSGSGSADPDGQVTAYEFEFGDGTTASGPNLIAHFFSAPGSYVVNLTVTDDDGNASAPDSLTVTVNAPPAARAYASPSTGSLGTVFLFDGSPSTDPDGAVSNWTWAFGDGTLGYGIVTTHSFASRTAFTVTLTVKDLDGAAATVTLSATVENRPPIASAEIGETVQPGGVVTLNALGSFDPDGDALTYLWIQTEGPPVSLTGADTAQPTFMPTEAGTYRFAVNVTDVLGSSATDQVTILVQASPSIPEPFPFWLIGVILIAIVLVLLALLMVLRQKRKPEERETENPEMPREDAEPGEAEEDLDRGGGEDAVEEAALSEPSS